MTKASAFSYQQSILFHAILDENLWNHVSSKRFDVVRQVIAGSIDAVPSNEIGELLYGVRLAVCSAGDMDDVSQRNTVLALCFAIWSAFPGSEDIFTIPFPGDSCLGSVEIGSNYQAILDMMWSPEPYAKLVASL